VTRTCSNAPCARFAAHCCVAVLVFTPSGFHRNFAKKPFRSETSRREETRGLGPVSPREKAVAGQELPHGKWASTESDPFRGCLKRAASPNLAGAKIGFLSQVDETGAFGLEPNALGGTIRTLVGFARPSV